MKRSDQLGCFPCQTVACGRRSHGGPPLRRRGLPQLLPAASATNKASAAASPVVEVDKGGEGGRGQRRLQSLVRAHAVPVHPQRSARAKRRHFGRHVGCCRAGCKLPPRAPRIQAAPNGQLHLRVCRAVWISWMECGSIAVS
jgi:hypothetical protein